MSLNSTVFRVQHTANGSTFAFSFPYLFLDETHLVVVETNTTTGVDTTKALTTDYTVTGEGQSAGGTVTFLVAPASGRVITISRIVPLTQLVDYNQSDAFPADTHEAALDKLTMAVQQISATNGTVDRSLRYPLTEPAGFVAELPASVDRVDTIMGFDSSGDLEVIDKSTFAIGPQGPQGPAGTNGTNGTNGVGVPTGGSAGQVLEKIDGTDYNTQWATPTAGGSILEVQIFS